MSLSAASRSTPSHSSVLPLRVQLALYLDALSPRLLRLIHSFSSTLFHTDTLVLPSCSSKFPCLFFSPPFKRPLQQLRNSGEAVRYTSALLPPLRLCFLKLDATVELLQTALRCPPVRVRMPATQVNRRGVAEIGIRKST